MFRFKGHHAILFEKAKCIAKRLDLVNPLPHFCL